MTQLMTETEHMVGHAGRVGVVLGDAQVGLMRLMVQPVENVWRLTHRRGEHPRVEGIVSAGYVGVDNDAWIDAVFSVDGAAGSGAPAGAEVLAV